MYDGVTELQNPSNIEELHNNAGVRTRMQTGYWARQDSNTLKNANKSASSKKAAAESAAFDADFNFVKESWPLLPDEIKAAIVATAKRGLNRQASRRMTIAAGGL